MELTPLWTPADGQIRQSNLARYMAWLNEKSNLHFTGYAELWQWSVKHPAEFWNSLWEYFDIQHDGEYHRVMSNDVMPFTRWFEGTSLSYAEHIFRNTNNEQPAIIAANESSEMLAISWKELQSRVAAFQQVLVQHNVSKGDTVVAFLPCIVEATIAFLAVNGLGAIWSSCSPDFGTQSVLDRFVQIKPKVLIATTRYQYNGKSHDKTAVVNDLMDGLPSLECTVILGKDESLTKHTCAVINWKDIGSSSAKLILERVPFSHPIWILFSSGTTGLPKAITHSHGGILLEQLKYGTFHNDYKRGERCFWYTTTGWMMWNYIHGSLLAGGVMVLYDGSPAWPNLEALWRFAATARINHFGTSAGFILANVKEKTSPRHIADLRELRSIGSTGSTLPPEGFAWIYEEVKKDLWLTSMSGGTDVCSAFVGGNPTWPVYAGEIQCRALGCNVEAWNDEGKPVIEEEGEMVITTPMPSMPIFFWNDDNHQRYLESYFEMYPGIWRHGDWIKITSRQGVVIYGRSDATLNRGGIRIGTSEIYRAVDQVKSVKDSLIVCIEKPGGEFWMPLFVAMREGEALTPEIKEEINRTIRAAYSPRHVPDEIIAVPEIPYTISGKKTEMPVKKILMGKDPQHVVNAGSLRNPDALRAFEPWSAKTR